MKINCLTVDIDVMAYLEIINFLQAHFMRLRCFIAVRFAHVYE
jgi:hypothetical protein